MDEDDQDQQQQSSNGYEPTLSSTPSTTRKKTYTAVPISRVNAIMRSCPNLTTVKNDAVALAAHAAELFIHDIVLKTHAICPDKHNLTYDILADYFQDIPFLKEAVPKKMTVREYRQLAEQYENERRLLQDSDGDDDDDDNNDGDENENDDEEECEEDGDEENENGEEDENDDNEDDDEDNDNENDNDDEDDDNDDDEDGGNDENNGDVEDND